MESAKLGKVQMAYFQGFFSQEVPKKSPKKSKLTFWGHFGNILGTFWGSQKGDI